MEHLVIDLINSKNNKHRNNDAKSSIYYSKHKYDN